MIDQSDSIEFWIDQLEREILSRARRRLVCKNMASNWTYICNEKQQKITGYFKGMMMTTVLSDSQLKRLAKHKYNASVSTLLDPYMQVWWRWFIEKLPLWIAPNTITILGLLTNLFTTLVLVYFSPQARSEVSRW